MERQLCTIGEDIGPVIDKLHERSRREYEKVLELCHLHGVKLSRDLLERGESSITKRCLDVLKVTSIQRLFKV